VIFRKSLNFRSDLAVISIEPAAFYFVCLAHVAACVPSIVRCQLTGLPEANTHVASGKWQGARGKGYVQHSPAGGRHQNMPPFRPRTPLSRLSGGLSATVACFYMINVTCPQTNPAKTPQPFRPERDRV